MMGLLSIADPLVRLLLTDRWVGVILLLQIMCLSQMWYPIHAINLNLLQVKGRSDLFLRLEIIKKIIGISILLITLPMGVAAMCLGLVVSSLITLFINTYYTGKLIQVGYVQQMKDLLPTLANAFSMGAIVWGITQMIHINVLAISAGAIIGLIYYLLIARMVQPNELHEVESMLGVQKIKNRLWKQNG
jgi:O-antigen/teichoic acid export membrane protein